MNAPHSHSPAKVILDNVNDSAVLSDFVGNDTTISARYPSCTPKEATDKWFYARRTTDLDYDAEASRSLSIGVEAGAILLPESATYEPILQRVRAAFADTFADRFQTYESADQIAEKIRQLRRKNQFKAVSPFPYIGTSADDYMVNPEISLSLSAKRNLSSLTSHTPNSIQGVHPNELESTLREAGLTKAYIKDDGTTGNHFAERFYASSESEIDQTWDTEIKRIMSSIRIARCRSLLVENYVESDENYSVQLNVSPDGTVELVHFSLQKTDVSGTYLGNDVDFTATSDQLPLAVQKVALEAGQAAAQRGWRGIFGLDILYKAADSNGQKDVATLIDPNFRLTGPTTVYLLRKKILELTGSKLGSLINIRSPNGQTIDQELRSLDKLLDNGDMLLLGGAVYSPTQWKLYGVALGNTWEQVLKTRRQISQINSNGSQLSMLDAADVSATKTHQSNNLVTAI